MYPIAAVAAPILLLQLEIEKKLRSLLTKEKEKAEVGITSRKVQPPTAPRVRGRGILVSPAERCIDPEVLPVQEEATLAAMALCTGTSMLP